MLKILYSFNKTGFEAAKWQREIRSASDDRFTFVPFNHEPYLPISRYLDSVALDRLYQGRNPDLMRMYRELEVTIREQRIEAMIVTNCPPYHPDFLRTLKIYKALYTTDDPGATYQRTVPYLHAYDHAFYVALAYSRDMDLGEKLRYCGVRNVDWLPISVFDFEFDPERTREEIATSPRDVDVVYVGHCFPQKMQLLTKLKRVFGSRARIHGFYRLKHNLYANIVHGYRGWIRSLGFHERVALYQRSKIGLNIHWNEFALGNQRLYQLPANGVMQICDCSDFLHRVFTPGKEIESYGSADELIDKVRYYLEDDDKRRSLALAGYDRTMKDYRFAHVTRIAADRIARAMQRSS
jgi:spore maturation protein CgeB